MHRNLLMLSLPGSMAQPMLISMHPARSPRPTAQCYCSLFKMAETFFVIAIAIFAIAALPLQNEHLSDADQPTTPSLHATRQKSECH